MVVVFIILDWIFVSMNATAMWFPASMSHVREKRGLNKQKCETNFFNKVHLKIECTELVERYFSWLEGSELGLVPGKYGVCYGGCGNGECVILAIIIHHTLKIIHPSLSSPRRGRGSGNPQEFDCDV